MAKFCGIIGYAKTSETSDGIWSEVITEKTYRGDVLKISKKYQSNENLNDDIVINNEISIVSDPYATENFQYMRYVKWMGVHWKISSIDVQYPRLILRIGGVYNGNKGPTQSIT
jgi:hypothetical protein